MSSVLKTVLKREINYLLPGDSFSVDSCVQNNGYLHHHDCLELNIVSNAAGAVRQIGDTQYVIGEFDMVLLGPNIPHGWLNSADLENSHQFTLHFHKDLLSKKQLEKNAFSGLRTLFNEADFGLKIDPQIFSETYNSISELIKSNEFPLLDFVAILNKLSNVKYFRLLSVQPVHIKSNLKFKLRVSKSVAFINEHFNEDIILQDISGEVSMQDEQLNQAFIKIEGIGALQYLNETRLKHALRYLTETDLSTAEIAKKCGFNNETAFQRYCADKTGLKPEDYKQQLASSLNYF